MGDAGASERRVPCLARSPSYNPESWAAQFGIISPRAAQDDPLRSQTLAPQVSPVRPPNMDSSGENDPLSSPGDPKAAAPALSAASAASMTSSPKALARRPSGATKDDDDWGESSFDGQQSSTPIKKPTLSEGSDLASLKKLVKQGSWRAIVDMVKDVKANRSLSQALDKQIVYSTYHVLALMKLRNYAAAQDEFSGLGDLNSSQYRFEEHPDFYPSKSGSMVPFTLRWLHAELPHWLGQTPNTIDRLYDLLARCNERIDFLHASVKRLSPDNERAADRTDENFRPRDQGHTPISAAEDVGNSRSLTDDVKGESQNAEPERSGGALSKSEDVGSNYISSEGLEEADFGEFVTSGLDKESNGHVVYGTLIHRWKRRQEVVLCTVLSHHLDKKDFNVCLTLLEGLVRKKPQDVVVLSKYGGVQLQLGDLYGARQTFAAIEGICEKQGSLLSKLQTSIVSRNRGLLYFSLKQYAKAVKEFDLVLQKYPGDIVAANNKALCLMYSRDLVGATQVLETVLQSNPVTALNETLVLNLCSMYELASMNSVEAKKTLSSWILRIAPDDFDMACTRL